VKRYFIRLENAEDVFIDREFSLLDEDLVIKTLKADGTILLEGIPTTSGFEKREVYAYHEYLRTRRSELLIEIPETAYDLVDPQFIMEFRSVGKGLYYEEGIAFEPRTFSLLDYGVYSTMERKIAKQVNIVVAYPSNIEPDKLYVTEQSSVIALGESTFSRRLALAKTAFGSDLYVQTQDPEILDDYRTWTTKFTEVRKNVYEIASKDYLMIESGTKEDLADLGPEQRRAFNHMLENARPVFITRNPAQIYQMDDDIPKDAVLVSLIRREDLEPFVRLGIEKIPCAHLFTVFNQKGQKFTEISLEEALDIPRTVIKKGGSTRDLKSLSARKMNLFYEYDPTTPLPACLRGCFPVEFEKVDMNDDGLLIWKRTDLIVMRTHKETYANMLATTGKRCFIEIKGPRELEIIEELGPLGLLQEFEVYDYPLAEGKPGEEYYISRPFNPNLKLEMGTKS